MCDNGHHGNEERRYAHAGDGVYRFTDMYSGLCAGTVFHPSAPEPYETECVCSCHEPIEADCPA